MVLKDKPSQFEQFCRELHQVLTHLYDYAYILNHPFCHWWGEKEEPGITRSQRVRQAILEAIELLNPGPRHSPRAPEARSYQILLQRFVEGKTPLQVSKELGITERQLYRNQKEAIEALGAVLWEEYITPQGRDIPQEQPHDQLLNEAERVQTASDQPVDLAEILLDVAHLLSASKAPPGLSLHLKPPSHPIVINTSRTLLRQALWQLIEGIVSFPAFQEITIDAQRDDSAAYIQTVISSPESHRLAAHLSEHVTVASQILAPLHGSASLQEEESQISIRLQLLTQQSTILVVEDNQETINLFERYLADQSCRLIGTTNPKEALRLAEEVRPSVILLDLMMPQEDGWELLQQLKANPETTSIPIVVCSVLPQETLANLLGASGYLRKPFIRAELVEALARWL